MFVSLEIYAQDHYIDEFTFEKDEMWEWYEKDEVKKRIEPHFGLTTPEGTKCVLFFWDDTMQSNCTSIPCKRMYFYFSCDEDVASSLRSGTTTIWHSISVIFMLYGFHYG